MNPFLISILLGFLSFVLLVNMFSIRIPKQPILQKRLEDIKNRGTQKSLANPEDDEFAFLYNNFRYKLFAKHLNNLKIIEKIKDQIALSGVNMEIDTYIIVSIMCTVPFAMVLLITSPKLLPLSLIGLFIPYSVLKFKANLRSAAFARQLPDTLDLLSNSLRAGHSIKQ